MQAKRRDPSGGCLFTIIVVIILVANAASPAAVPALMNYQGKITDAEGAVLNGDFSLTFRVYDSAIGGSLRWQETQAVNITDGMFQVVLGAVNPLNAAVFSNPTTYLGITVGVGSEMTPRRRIASTAYAHRVGTVDGAQAGIINGDLKIQGNVTSTESVFTDCLDAGTPSNSGEIRLFATGSSNPVGELRRNSSGGGELSIYDASHGISVYASRDVSSGNGGFLSLFRNGASALGINMDGNYAGTQSPRVIFQDNNSAVVFDLGVDGDSAVMLPFNSISSVETAHEAGLADAKQSEGVVFHLNDDFTAFQTVLQRNITCPRSGWIVAIATAELEISHVNGSKDVVRFALSDNPTSIEQNNVLDYSQAAEAETGDFNSIVTLHSAFQVGPGANSIYLRSTRSQGGPANIANAKLTLLFLPTWYGAPLNSELPTSDEIDQLVVERIREETSQLEAQFEQRLRELEEEVSKQRTTSR